VHSLKDYNRYCYYVAGLVGVGLSRLFAAGGAWLFLAFGVSRSTKAQWAHAPAREDSTAMRARAHC
jgi:phytoene/squalene synthetase